MKLLALDFDGVISDSAPEAFVVALRTYTVLCPTETFTQELEALEQGSCPSCESVRASARYLGFIELMPLGNRAEDYAVSLRILESGDRIFDQEAYDARRAAQPKDFLRAFHRRFYEERAALRERDARGWRALLGPYPGFVDLLRRREGEVDLAIATAKDRRSVARLLREYGIADLFHADRILDKDTGETKRTHLEVLKRVLGIPYQEITFIDDKVNHLEDVSTLGVRCALAAWGYNAEREHRRARGHGYLVCDLADVERTLFG